MSTVTMNAPDMRALDTAAADAGATATKGFFARMLAAMTDAQYARAERVAFSHLSQMSDANLAELGYSAEKIERIRTFRGSTPIWF